MKLFVFILLLNFLQALSFSQTSAYIKGKITKASNGDPLKSVNIVVDTSHCFTSDIEGNYLFKIEPGEYTLCFRHLGYKRQCLNISVFPHDTLKYNIRLEADIYMLDKIVVSAAKYEQKLSDIIVSMDVLKSARISVTNTTSLETAINNTPGIDVLDGQPRIRGGSGYSYGAGSRVLVLMDDLPILAADAADVKWEYLPIENIVQVEIIKGASSVLYGSSALNGVINIRTAYPKNKPQTKITVFNCIYLNPKRKELIWWENQPIFTGASAFHSRKIGNTDIVSGCHFFSNSGYRENEREQRGRFNLNLLHRNKKFHGLSYGMNSNIMYHDKSDFFLWQNAYSGAYRQNPAGIANVKGVRLNIDPYLEYFNSKGSKHSLKTRYFTVNNDFAEDLDKNNKSDLFYGEYKYHQRFNDLIDFSIGVSASYAKIISRIYGNHSGFNGSVYSQIDTKPHERINLSIGMRYETFRLDDEKESSKPVFRTGINVKLAAYSNLRASFGQGYRFPSVAEKYTSTHISSLNIFPNPGLNSETGWSFETGIKQGFKLNSWKGYIDVSVFRTKYKDMIEFTFGVYNKPDSLLVPTLEYLGFKALNIGNAQITGLEIIIVGEGEVLNIPVTLLAGYTYIKPIDLDYSASNSTSSSENDILKYRFQHSVKSDIEFNWKKLSTGFNFIYNSFMVNVDEMFVNPFIGEIILPGYASYREKYDYGYIVFDHRISYRFTEHSKLAFITKNIFNREYIGRPGDIAPPVNITLQFSVDF